MPEPGRRISGWSEQNKKSLAIEIEVLPDKDSADGSSGRRTKLPEDGDPAAPGEGSELPALAEPAPDVGKVDSEIKGTSSGVRFEQDAGFVTRIQTDHGVVEKCEAKVEITTEPRARNRPIPERGGSRLSRMMRGSASSGSSGRTASSKVTLKYTGLPTEVQRIISKWDTDQSGCVDLEELEAASRAQEDLHNRAHFYRRLAVASLGICILFGLMVFFLSYASMELAKDIHVGDGAVMVTATGQVVQTSNNEITVDKENGEIIVRLSTTLSPEGRRLQADCIADGGGTECTQTSTSDAGPALKTARATMVAPFTSKLTQAQLSTMLMIRIMASSDVGTDLGLHLDVLSTVRQVALGSSCGYVYAVKTPEGSLLLDNDDLWVDPQLAEVLQAEGLIPESIPVSNPVRVGTLANFMLEGTFDVKFRSLTKEDRVCDRAPVLKLPEGPQQSLYYDATLHHLFLDGSSRDVRQNVVRTQQTLAVVYSTDTQSHVQVWDLEQHQLTTFVLSNNRRLYCQVVDYGEEIALLLFNSSGVDTFTADEWTFAGNTMTAFPRLRSVFHLEGPVGRVELTADALTMAPISVKVLPMNANQEAAGRSPFAEVTFTPGSMRFNATLEEAQARLLSLGAEMWPGCGEEAELEAASLVGGLSDGMGWLARESFQTGPAATAPMPLSTETQALVDDCVVTCYRALLGDATSPELALISCMGAFDDDGECDSSHLHVSARLEDASTRSPTQGGRWGDVDMTVETSRTGVRWPLLAQSSLLREGVLRSRAGMSLENLEVMGAEVQLPSHEMLVSSLLVGNPPRLQGTGSELVLAKLRKDAGEGITVAALLGLHFTAPLCMSKANSGMFPASCQPHPPVSLGQELEVLVPASWWMAPFVWHNERTLATGTWTMEAMERTINDDGFGEIGGDEPDDFDDYSDNGFDFNGTFEDAADRGQSDEDGSISETPQYKGTEQAVLSTFAAFSTSGEEPQGCWSSAAVACLTRCQSRTIVNFAQCASAVDRRECAQYDYCPFVTQIEADTDEWTTKADLSSALTAGTGASFPPTIRAVSQHLLDWMSSQPDVSVWLTVAEPTALKSLLQQATLDSLNGVNLGVAVAMTDLAKYLIMARAGGTSDQVAKTLKWPSLSASRAAVGGSTATPLVSQDLVDALMIRAVASGEDFGGEEELDPAIFIDSPTTYSDVSFDVDLRSANSELTVTFKTVSVTLLFPGTNFKMVVQADGLSTSQTLAQGATHIDVLDDPIRKMELGGGKQVMIALSKDDQDVDEPVEGDTWKVPAEGTQVYLGEVLPDSHQLPSWLPVDVMNVRTFTWDMSNKTLRLTCEGHIPAPTTDTSVRGYDMLAHVDIKDTGGGTTTKLTVEWINTTIVLNGVCQKVSNRLDETALAAMPSMSLLLGSNEYPRLVTAAANSSLTFLGVMLPVARHAEVSHLNLEVDLGMFVLTEASLSNALFHLYAGLQPLQVRTAIDTTQDGVVFEAKVPSLAVDELPFVVSSTGTLVAMGRPSGTELLNLFFDSFHFALEEGDFEGGPEGIINGAMLQKPTSAVMTSLSLHLQRLLCHGDNQARVTFQNASLQLNKGSFQVQIVLYDVEWDIHPGASFPMLGNIGIRADSFTLMFPTSLILRDFPRTSKLGGDARLRMSTIEADGLSLTLPRMSELDNTTLHELQLEPANFSSCSWREMEFSGDAMSVLEASPTLKGRLGRVVFAHKQALQLTGDMPVTTTFSEGATAMFNVRLWGVEIEDEEDVTPILDASSVEQPPFFRLQMGGPAAFSSGGARRLKDWNSLRRLQELTEIDGIPRRLSAIVPADQEAKDSITASENVIIYGGLRFVPGVLADWLPMLEVSGSGVESEQRRLLREATDPQNHPVARRLQDLSYESCQLPRGSGIEMEDNALYSCETMIDIPKLPAETEADLLISDEKRCNLTSVINLTEDGFDPVVTLGQPLLKYILLQYAVPDSDAETVSKRLNSDSLEVVTSVIIDMIGGNVTSENVQKLLTTLGVPNSMRNRYVRSFLEGTLVWSGLPAAAAKSVANNATITDTVTALGYMAAAMSVAIGGDLAMHSAMSALGVSNPEVVIMGPILAQAMQAMGTSASDAESLVYDITTLNCLQTKMFTPSIGLQGMLGQARELWELKATNFTAVCDLAKIMCVTSDVDLETKYLKPMVRGRLTILHVSKANVEAAVTSDLLSPLVQVCKGSPTAAEQADADNIYILLANQATRTERDAALTTVMASQSVTVTTDLSRATEMFRIWGIPSSALLDLSTASLYTAPERYEDVAGLEALWIDAGFDFVGAVLVPILRGVSDAMGVSPDANWALQNNLATAVTPSGDTTVQQTVVTALSQLTAGLAGEAGTNMCPVFLNLLQSIDSLQLLTKVVSSAVQNTFEAFSIPSVVTNNVVTFLGTEANAKLFMGAPACSAIFARTATIADFEAVMELVGDSPTDAVFQPTIENSLVKIGATATQAAAFSSQVTLLKLGDFGSGIMALMTRIGEPKSVGLEIYDILTGLDPADGTNTPLAVVQEVVKSKLISLGVAEAVATAASQGVTDANLRKVCQESLGALVTGNMDFNRMESVLKQLAQQSLADIDLTMSSLLSAALRNIGVDVTSDNVKSLLDTAKRGLIKDQSGDIMRGRIDVSLVLGMMTELNLDATAKFAQPYFERGLTTLCGGAPLSDLGGYQMSSVQNVEHVAMLHDENFDVDALLDDISAALGQTRSTIKTNTLRPCAQRLLVNAGVDAAGAGTLLTAIFKPTLFSSKSKRFLNGLLHKRLNTQLIQDVAASINVAAPSVTESTMTQATTTDGVLAVLETSRQLWAEVPQEAELPGQTKVQSPDTQICLRVITKDSFLNGLSPSPIKGLLRFSSNFSSWTLATSQVRFDMGNPLAAKISVQLLANSSGLIVVGQGTVTDTVLAPYLPDGIVKFFTGLKGTFKAQLNVPLANASTASASGTRRLDSRSTTMQSYGLVALMPPSFGSDVLTLQGSGQFFFSLNGPLSSLNGTLLKVQGCLNVSSNELGMPVGVNATAVLSMNPQKNYSLLTRVQANFRVNLQSVNLGVIEVPTRLKYDNADGSLAAVGRLLNLNWSVPGTDFNVVVSARTTMERSNRHPNTTTQYSFEILGCESNFTLPFHIMPSQPKPTAELRASISVQTGHNTTWDVRGRVEAGFGGIIKNAVLELSVNSSHGLNVFGAAQAQLKFPGDIGVIPAYLEVEWSPQRGLRGKANAPIPLTPPSWGINPAIANITYDPVNGLQANATIEDVLDLRSMIPSQSFVDTVAVRASVSYPRGTVQMVAYANFTLPSWLGSKDLVLIVDINERGLTIYGSLMLDYMLLNSKGYFGHDLSITKVEVMAIAPWGSKSNFSSSSAAASTTGTTTPMPSGTSSSATMIVEANLGVVFHGIAGFENQFCGAFTLTETPDWLVNILKQGNLQITTGRAVSFSLCRQITLFDYYGDVANRLATQNDKLFPATAIAALNNVKQVFKSLPARILLGVHVTLPCAVIEGTPSANFMQTIAPNKKSTYESFFNYDPDLAIFRIGMGLPALQLPKVGPILEFQVQANIEASWQVGAVPNINIRGTIEMKIKLGKDNHLHFVGSMAFGTLIEAELELLAPTVIPIISRRFVLVRTPNFPVRALFRLTITGNLVVEFSGGLLLSTDRLFSLQSGKDDGLNALSTCNSDINCYSLQVLFILDVNTAIPALRNFKLNMRMKPGLLTPPEFILALLGVPLPNAAIATLKATIAPVPVMIGLDLLIGITGLRAALAMATRWDIFESDIMLAAVFDWSYGKFPDLRFRMAANAFCLGVRSGSNCFGMQVKKTTLGPEIYDDTKAMMQEIWGEGWSDTFLPPRLQDNSNVGPAISAQLQPVPKFQLAAAAELSGGPLDLSWLGSWSIEVSISPSEIMASVQTVTFGIRYEFNLDVSLGLPPALNKFEFVMDFTGLFDAIKQGARDFLGSTLYTIANALGVFDIIRIDYGRFSISKWTVSLEIKLKIFFEIHLSLTLDFSIVAKIIAGEFWDLAKSALQGLKDKVANFRPCDCVGPWQSPLEYTWGPYTEQRTGRSILCGLETYYYDTCGTNILCGFTVEWCGGRRRWYSVPYPCGGYNHYCCWTLPGIRNRHCTYSVPQIGYHWSNRRRWCNTVTVCPKNLFRTWKYQ